jgi:hypothetical protein
MPAPARQPLGASTLNRKFWVDVDTSTTSTPTWVGVHGMTSFQPTQTPDLVDDSDMDSGGYRSSTKTADAWGLTFTLARKVQEDDAEAYDPGQEFLRDKADNMGPANSVHVRYYEMGDDGPRVEAYEGRCAVSWSPQSGDMAALSLVDVVLTGQGRRNVITHPDA